MEEYDVPTKDEVVASEVGSGEAVPVSPVPAEPAMAVAPAEAPVNEAVPVSPVPAEPAMSVAPAEAPVATPVEEGV